MSRPYNFSPGPAALPESVLRRARDEMLDWRGSGQSVMEMSHRGAEFRAIAEKAESDLRHLMSIPDDYRILFLQGGASAQFAAVPMNLARGRDRADYINTGTWSKKAIAEGLRYIRVNEAASGASDGFNSIPAPTVWSLSEDAAYVHYTPNETIGGVEFHWVPDVGDVPLVADMSSTVLSRPIDVGRFALIYAGAQKNIGPAGLVVVIVREDLLGNVIPGTPSLYDFGLQARTDSMANTPPTYSWYVAGLMLEWLLEQGGLEAMGERNRRKADMLYRAIDDSDFYHNPVASHCRSWMNVPFTLARPELDVEFLREAAAGGLLNLKGHRSVGGMRASIYNAMPEDGVARLVEFMGDFERRRA